MELLWVCIDIGRSKVYREIWQVSQSLPERLTGSYTAASAWLIQELLKCPPRLFPNSESKQLCLCWNPLF